MARPNFWVRFNKYKKFFLVFIGLFLVVEYVLQKTDDKLVYTYFYADSTTGFWDEDPELFWVDRNYDKWMDELEDLPSEKLVYCFGGSIVRGDFASTSFCKEMASCLPEGYKTFNFGTSGYTSHQSLVLFKRAIKKKVPKIAIVCHGWNDLQGAPANDRDMAVRNRRISTHILYWITKSKIVQMIRHGIRMLPGQDPYKVEMPQKWHLRVDLPAYRENLDFFSEIAKEKGIDLVLLSQGNPDPASKVHLKRYFDWLEPIADSRKHVYYFDLGAEVDRMIFERFGRPSQNHYSEEGKYLFVDQCHFNDYAHGEVAKLLCNYLKEQKLVP